MIASEYPVTFGYGATDTDYYGPLAVGKATYIGAYHRGDDRAMPMRTPVWVNGVLIGLSGNGKGRYAPHLHIGKWINGGNQDVNPNGAGFPLDSPRVLEIDTTGKDQVNGPYIKLIDVHGTVWVYLHLEQVNVKVGQVLDGGQKIVEPAFNEGDRANWNNALYGRDYGAHKDLIGVSFKAALEAIRQSVTFLSVARVNGGDVANYFHALVGKDPTSEEQKAYTGRTHKDCIYDLLSRDDVKARLLSIDASSKAAAIVAAAQKFKEALESA
jgi:hypothetical protein